MSAHHHHHHHHGALRGVKALAFDVFGTVVDWRTSVEAELRAAAAAKAPAGAEVDWARFAADWRASYAAFTSGFRAGETPWKDVDAHHRDGLAELLRARGLDAGAPEVDELSRAWHRLRPWPDAPAGIRALNEMGLVTAALSNGNRSLLADLDRFGGLGFARLISAEDFKAYKPDPKTYLGAAEMIGVRPEEVAMVAAHLGDLDAARKLGLRTIYVERRQEEGWQESEERYQAAKQWVDLWVGVDEGGFVEVARRLRGAA